jgi:methyl acetate hydrolase
MNVITRREFAGVSTMVVTKAAAAAGPALDERLRASLRQTKIPFLVAMAAGPENTLYTGAFGARADDIFRIASMTKAITTTAAMQLVEQGKLRLDEPVAKHLPALEKLHVLTGVHNGKPVFHPASKPVLLRHLLTHTSGFAYDTWDEKLFQLSASGPQSGDVQPLVFQPGTRWEYGVSIDWTGRLVEAVSGETLEAYFQRHILQPLGMNDTSFILPPAKLARLIASGDRQKDGSIKRVAATQPPAPKSFNGGGGLFSTASDYVRFMQMILRHGLAHGGERILQAKTVEAMSANQIGDLSAGKLKTYRTERSADVDFHPGVQDGFTYGFLINEKAYEGGRSAGSLAWAGLLNTFYWIDPRRAMCAVVLMQFLPFCDPGAMQVLRDFERALYEWRT